MTHTSGTLDLSNKVTEIDGHLFFFGGDLVLTDGTLIVHGNLYMTDGSIVLNGGELDIRNSVYQGGGTVDLNGGTLKTSGDYRLQEVKISDKYVPGVQGSYGTLIMDDENDQLIVGGNFFMESNSHYNTFTAGTMELKGNFFQTDNGFPNFDADSKHTVILNGTDKQKISMESPSAQFANLQIVGGPAQGYRVTFANYLAVENFIGSCMASADELKVNGLVMSGQSLTLKGDVVMYDDVYLPDSTLYIDRNLIQPSGCMDPAGGKLEVKGDYRIQSYSIYQDDEPTYHTSSGSLRMNAENTRVIVHGDFVIQSDSTTNSFTNGVMEVRGDFSQLAGKDNYQSFLASNDHKVILNGNGPQKVTFEGTNCAFNILDLYQKYSQYTFSRVPCWKVLLKNGVSTVVITAQPESVQQEIGKKFTITVAANGDGLKYQWYYKEGYMKEFRASNNKTASYSYTMQDYMHERSVYCVITDANGNSVQSETATITRPPMELKILEQPQNIQQEVGQKFSISPKVQGDGLTYQWYYKDAGMKDFKVSSNKSSAYSYTMVAYMNGRQVYCTITDKLGNSVTTDPITISLPPVELKILQQPTDVNAALGEKFSISAKVQGDDLTYQWYYKDAGMKDFKVSSNKSSAYSYTMVAYMNKRQVYCVITDKYGNSVTTDTVTISLPPVELKILQQPTDVNAALGEKFSISAKVQGDGLTYQWYYKEGYMKDFKASSNKSSAYAYSMQSYMNQRSVYCVIADEFGNQVQTEVVTIHLEK